MPKYDCHLTRASIVCENNINTRFSQTKVINYYQIIKDMYPTRNILTTKIFQTKYVLSRARNVPHRGRS